MISQQGESFPNRWLFSFAMTVFVKIEVMDVFGVFIRQELLNVERRAPSLLWGNVRPFNKFVAKDLWLTMSGHDGVVQSSQKPYPTSTTTCLDAGTCIIDRAAPMGFSSHYDKDDDLQRPTHEKEETRQRVVCEVFAASKTAPHQDECSMWLEP